MILVLVVYGAFWLLQSFNHVFSRIMPGSGVVLSTSMKPYDLVFRLQPWGEENQSEPWEWHLRVPRAFVTRENGSNGVVYRSTKGGGDEYFVTLQTLVSEDGKTFIPTAGQPPDKQRIQSLIIHLKNEFAGVPADLGNLCVPQHLGDEILKPFGISSVYDRPCDDRDLRCTIYTHMDGWGVEIAATKDLYGNPENVCQLTRELLESYTVKRNVIARPGNP